MGRDWGAARNDEGAGSWLTCSRLSVACAARRTRCLPRTSHVRTSHVARGTWHVARGTWHVARGTPARYTGVSGIGLRAYAAIDNWAARRSAAARNERAAGESGSPITIGTPVSPPMRIG